MHTAYLPENTFSNKWGRFFHDYKIALILIHFNHLTQISNVSQINLFIYIRNLVLFIFKMKVWYFAGVLLL